MYMLEGRGGGGPQDVTVCVCVRHTLEGCTHSGWQQMSEPAM